MSDQKEPALVVTSFSKSFGGVHAVRSVNLSVSAGERRALIGPNGAGKTTLFNLIAGELKSDTGSAVLFGTDITRKSVQQRAKLGLGRTYQISQLFLKMTVEENLFLAAARSLPFQMLQPWNKRMEEREIALQAAEQVGLQPFLGQAVADLSHGQQRQLELGMAIAMRPRLIMLDEPAAGLSPSERILLAKLIKDLPRETTLILIEHDMEIVLDLADAITVLNRGEVIAEGSPSAIRSNQEVQKVYLGGSYA